MKRLGYFRNHVVDIVYRFSLTLIGFNEFFRPVEEAIRPIFGKYCIGRIKKDKVGRVHSLRPRRG